ncbi:MAG: hypothetical protein B7X02_01560 [Rhodospirillales bacterium 12-54-5]|nr:MAG: hypothetical protein B7X02_01560 [Rhodospirillales bacterium 12-54-5]
MMTAKARALGMSHTHFENPNGLPNANQYTTARDMAKLGIALKRDFPKYFPYFAVRQFSWGGVSYYTHNRVMLRYAGVDGIKTGFIGASGFNLVTSAKRGGRPLVGVVMGGGSGRWRDDRMIQLLDETYKTLANRGAARGKGDARNLPLSKNGAAGVPSSKDDDVVTPDMGDSNNAASAATDDDDTAAAAIAEKPAPFAKAVPPAVTTSAMPDVSTKATSPASIEASATAPTVAPPPTDWMIQVGAFTSNPKAVKAAKVAYRLAREHLQDARVRIELAADDTYRARLVGISEYQANQACAVLATSNAPCLAMHDDTTTPPVKPKKR